MNDRELDHALRSLPRVDLEPLAARSVRVAAQRRLSSDRAAPSHAALLRWEALALTLLSALQVLWAAARVLALVR